MNVRGTNPRCGTVEIGPPTYSVVAFTDNGITVGFPNTGNDVCPQCGGGCEIKFTSTVPFSRIHQYDRVYTGTCPAKDAPVALKFRHDPDGFIRFDFSVFPAIAPNPLIGAFLYLPPEWTYEVFDEPVVVELVMGNEEHITR